MIKNWTQDIVIKLEWYREKTRPKMSKLEEKSNNCNTFLGEIIDRKIIGFLAKLAVISENQNILSCWNLELTSLKIYI